MSIRIATLASILFYLVPTSPFICPPSRQPTGLPTYRPTSAAGCEASGSKPWSRVASEAAWTVQREDEETETASTAAAGSSSSAAVTAARQSLSTTVAAALSSAPSALEQVWRCMAEGGFAGAQVRRRGRCIRLVRMAASVGPQLISPCGYHRHSNAHPSLHVPHLPRCIHTPVLCITLQVHPPLLGNLSLHPGCARALTSADALDIDTSSLGPLLLDSIYLSQSKAFMQRRGSMDSTGSGSGSGTASRGASPVHSVSAPGSGTSSRASSPGLGQPARPGAYPCTHPGCGHIAVSRSKLERHLNNNHNQIKALLRAKGSGQPHITSTGTRRNRWSSHLPAPPKRYPHLAVAATATGLRPSSLALQAPPHACILAPPLPAQPLAETALVEAVVASSAAAVAAAASSSSTSSPAHVHDGGGSRAGSSSAVSSTPSAAVAPASDLSAVAPAGTGGRPKRARPSASPNDDAAAAAAGDDTGHGRGSSSSVSTSRGRAGKGTGAPSSSLLAADAGVDLHWKPLRQVFDCPPEVIQHGQATGAAATSHRTHHQIDNSDAASVVSAAASVLGATAIRLSNCHGCGGDGGRAPLLSCNTCGGYVHAECDGRQASSAVPSSSTVSGDADGDSIAQCALCALKIRITRFIDAESIAVRQVMAGLQQQQQHSASLPPSLPPSIADLLQTRLMRLACARSIYAVLTSTLSDGRPLGSLLARLPPPARPDSHHLYSHPDVKEHVCIDMVLDRLVAGCYDAVPLHTLSLGVDTSGALVQPSASSSTPAATSSTAGGSRRGRRPGAGSSSVAAAAASPSSSSSVVATIASPSAAASRAPARSSSAADAASSGTAVVPSGDILARLSSSIQSSPAFSRFTPDLVAMACNAMLTGWPDPTVAPSPLVAHPSAVIDDTRSVVGGSGGARAGRAADRIVPRPYQRKLSSASRSPLRDHHQQCDSDAGSVAGVTGPDSAGATGSGGGGATSPGGFSGGPGADGASSSATATATKADQAAVTAATIMHVVTAGIEAGVASVLAAAAALTGAKSTRAANGGGGDAAVTTAVPTAAAGGSGAPSDAADVEMASFNDTAANNSIDELQTAVEASLQHIDGHLSSLWADAARRREHRTNKHKEKVIARRLAVLRAREPRSSGLRAFNTSTSTAGGGKGIGRKRGRDGEATSASAILASSVAAAAAVISSQQPAHPRQAAMTASASASASSTTPLRAPPPARLPTAVAALPLEWRHGAGALNPPLPPVCLDTAPVEVRPDAGGADGDEDDNDTGAPLRNVTVHFKMLQPLRQQQKQQGVEGETNGDEDADQPSADALQRSIAAEFGLAIEGGLPAPSAAEPSLSSSAFYPAQSSAEAESAGDGAPSQKQQLEEWRSAQAVYQQRLADYHRQYQHWKQQQQAAIFAAQQQHRHTRDAASAVKRHGDEEAAASLTAAASSAATVVAAGAQVAGASAGTEASAATTVVSAAAAAAEDIDTLRSRLSTHPNEYDWLLCVLLEDQGVSLDSARIIAASAREVLGKVQARRQADAAATASQMQQKKQEQQPASPSAPLPSLTIPPSSPIDDAMLSLLFPSLAAASHGLHMVPGVGLSVLVPDAAGETRLVPISNKLAGHAPHRADEVTNPTDASGLVNAILARINSAAGAAGGSEGGKQASLLLESLNAAVAGASSSGTGTSGLTPDQLSLALAVHASDLTASFGHLAGRADEQWLPKSSLPRLLHYLASLSNTTTGAAATALPIATPMAAAAAASSAVAPASAPSSDALSSPTAVSPFDFERHPDPICGEFRGDMSRCDGCRYGWSHVCAYGHLVGGLTRKGYFIIPAQYRKLKNTEIARQRSIKAGSASTELVINAVPTTATAASYLARTAGASEGPTSATVSSAGQTSLVLHTGIGDGGSGTGMGSSSAAQVAVMTALQHFQGLQQPRPGNATAPSSSILAAAAGGSKIAGGPFGKAQPPFTSLPLHAQAAVSSSDAATIRSSLLRLMALRDHALLHPRPKDEAEDGAGGDGGGDAAHAGGAAGGGDDGGLYYTSALASGSTSPALVSFLRRRKLTRPDMNELTSLSLRMSVLRPSDALQELRRMAEHSLELWHAQNGHLLNSLTPSTGGTGGLASSPSAVAAASGATGIGAQQQQQQSIAPLPLPVLAYLLYTDHFIASEVLITAASETDLMPALLTSGLLGDQRLFESMGRVGKAAAPAAGDTAAENSSVPAPAPNGTASSLHQLAPPSPPPPAPFPSFPWHDLDGPVPFDCLPADLQATLMDKARDRRAEDEEARAQRIDETRRHRGLPLVKEESEVRAGEARRRQAEAESGEATLMRVALGSGSTPDAGAGTFDPLGAGAASSSAAPSSRRFAFDPAVPLHPPQPAPDANIDVCVTCLQDSSSVGDLVCCEKCPRTWCNDCLGITDPAQLDDPWYCGHCTHPIPVIVLRANSSARLGMPVPRGSVPGEQKAPNSPAGVKAATAITAGGLKRPGKAPLRVDTAIYGASGAAGAAAPVPPAAAASSNVLGDLDMDLDLGLEMDPNLHADLLPGASLPLTSPFLPGPALPTAASASSGMGFGSMDSLSTPSACALPSPASSLGQGQGLTPLGAAIGALLPALSSPLSATSVTGPVPVPPQQQAVDGAGTGTGDIDDAGASYPSDWESQCAAIEAAEPALPPLSSYIPTLTLRHALRMVPGNEDGFFMWFALQEAAVVRPRTTAADAYASLLAPAVGGKGAPAPQSTSQQRLPPILAADQLLDCLGPAGKQAMLYGALRRWRAKHSNPVGQAAAAAEVGKPDAGALATRPTTSDIALPPRGCSRTEGFEAWRARKTVMKFHSGGAAASHVLPLPPMVAAAAVAVAGRSPFPRASSLPRLQPLVLTPLPPTLPRTSATPLSAFMLAPTSTQLLSLPAVDRPAPSWGGFSIAQLEGRAVYNTERLALGRSRIDGTGLFATCDIEADDVIAEYSGEVVGEEVCNAREKYYESKGIADYMFRMGPDEIVDATLKGCRARYVNHSCDPSCFAVITLPDGSNIGSSGNGTYADAMAMQQHQQQQQPLASVADGAAVDESARAGIANVDGSGDIDVSVGEVVPAAAAVATDIHGMQIDVDVTGAVAAATLAAAVDGGGDAGSMLGKRARVPSARALDAAAEQPSAAAVAPATKSALLLSSPTAEAPGSEPRHASLGPVAPGLAPPGRPLSQRVYTGRRVFIYALRKIRAGEELTYDYQFPADEAKIPCKCGAANCRGTLNQL